MDFFKQKWVKIAAWCMLAVSLAILVLSGMTQEEINKGIVLIFGVIAAVAAVVAFIVGQLQKDETKKLN